MRRLTAIRPFMLGQTSGNRVGEGWRYSNDSASQERRFLSEDRSWKGQVEDLLFTLRTLYITQVVRV